MILVHRHPEALLFLPQPGGRGVSKGDGPDRASPEALEGRGSALRAEHLRMTVVVHRRGYQNSTHMRGKTWGNFAFSFPRRSALTSTTVGNVPLSFLSYGMHAST